MADLSPGSDLVSATNAAEQSSPASTATPVQATTASSFVNSIGVNAHIDSGKPIWENTQVVAAELAALGIKHVRDGTPYDWALQEYVTLAKTGVTFDLSQENPIAAPMTTIGAAEDVQRADTLAQAVPGSVESLEGANEYNISSYNLNGSNSNGNMPWGVADDANLQAAVRADPTLAGVKVVAASTADVASAPVVSPDVDIANWHVYGGVGQQLGANLAAGIAAAQATAPGKPVYVTEAGVSSSGYGSSTWGVADQPTQGIIDTDALLDSYKDGAAQTFLYDLMDDTNNTPQENQFGLFNADGTAKPAATDIGNLVSLLSDTGTATSPPGTLAYTIAGLPSTASSMLLQKSDGTFDIVVWNGGATLYNGTSDVTPPTVAVTVTFGGVQQQVKVYDPVTGRIALQSMANAGAVTFGLSEDPVIIAVTPAALPVAPAAPVSTTLPVASTPPAAVTPPPAAALVLNLSEDAWQGDAQFSVSVDGVQVGGPQAVTALHSQGQSEAFSLAGTFGTGTHQVAVTFLNDAYGGTPTTDRNLYVDGITLGGAASPGAAATLYSSGAQIFSVSASTAVAAPTPVAAPAAIPAAAAPISPDTLVLHLSEDAWQGDAQFVASVDGKPLGAAQAVTALHGTGGGEAFSFTGNFGAGAHDLAVTFLNDAYGGTPATDRNLYVNSATLDGSQQANVTGVLYSSGTTHFQVVVPNA